MWQSPPPPRVSANASREGSRPAGSLLDLTVGLQGRRRSRAAADDLPNPAAYLAAAARTVSRSGGGGGGGGGGSGRFGAPNTSPAAYGAAAGKEAGPGIFLPGTTMTREDVELLHLRHSSFVEQAAAERSELEAQLSEQAGLIDDLTAELERVRTREARLLGSTQLVDTESSKVSDRLQTTTDLLLENEAELVSKTSEIDRLLEANRELRIDVERQRADLDAETCETDALRNELHDARSELEDLRGKMTELNKECSSLHEVNALYKATHEKFIKEGQLSCQLAITVESLKKEVSSTERKMLGLQDDRVAAAKSIAEDAQDFAGFLLPVMQAGKDLAAARLASRGTDDPGSIVRASPDFDWESAVRTLQSLQQKRVEVTAPHLQDLANMVQAAGSAAESNLDLTVLRREIEALQNDDRASNEKTANAFAEHAKDIRRQMKHALRGCAAEMQTAASMAQQYEKAVRELNEDLAAFEERQEPLLAQTRRLGDELTRLQREAGEKHASLMRDQAALQEADYRIESLEAAEDLLKERLRELESENSRMKTFMAKLQIADVPELHSLLAAAATPSQEAPS
ncbi:hypothetical protein DIPPA_16294 [Diplonema papillatum]|nr:hypothetical protein DIPPA_16294 [Diplonema papillatum]